MQVISLLIFRELWTNLLYYASKECNGDDQTYMRNIRQQTRQTFSNWLIEAVCNEWTRNYPELFRRVLYVHLSGKELKSKAHRVLGRAIASVQDGINDVNSKIYLLLDSMVCLKNMLTKNILRWNMTWRCSCVTQLGTTAPHSWQIPTLIREKKQWI